MLCYMLLLGLQNSRLPPLILRTVFFKEGELLQKFISIFTRPKYPGGYEPLSNQ